MIHHQHLHMITICLLKNKRLLNAHSLLQNIIHTLFISLPSIHLGEKNTRGKWKSHVTLKGVKTCRFGQKLIPSNGFFLQIERKLFPSQFKISIFPLFVTKPKLISFPNDSVQLLLNWIPNEPILVKLRPNHQT